MLHRRFGWRSDAGAQVSYVFEVSDNTWRRPGDPELFRAIRSCWSFVARHLRPEFPPGIYKHRSIEEAENFNRFQSRKRQ